jgi:hypothetical protein
VKISWGIGTFIHDNETKVQTKTIQLNVYPNPCENRLNLDLENFENGEINYLEYNQLYVNRIRILKMSKIY